MSSEKSDSGIKNEAAYAGMEVVQEAISAEVTSAVVILALLATLAAIFGLKKGAEKLYSAATGKEADNNKEPGAPSKEMPQLPPLDGPSAKPASEPTVPVAKSVQEPEGHPVKQQQWAKPKPAAAQELDQNAVDEEELDEEEELELEEQDAARPRR